MQTKQARTFKPFKNTDEMLEEYGQLESRWSNETILNTRMLLWLCQHFEQRRVKRKASAWNMFFGKCMKRGMGAKEAAQLWRHKQRAA